MAKAIKYDWEVSPHPNKASYDWENWLDGQSWELVHGEDYMTDSFNFRRYAYAVAKERGVKVKTRVLSNSVILQAVPEDHTDTN